MVVVHALLLLGVGAVLPLALGGRARWWALAATAAAVSLLLPAGWLAAALVAPWLAVSAHRTLDAARPGAGLHTLAAAWAVIAAGAFFTSRLGANPLDFHEPLIELTAVHYTYAGAAALTLALATRPGRLHRAAVGLTAAAPPVVAVGFFTHHPLPQVGGAVLMALGVWATGTLHLQAAAGRHAPAPARARALLAVSGLAIWVPMVLAVAWAAGQHWAIPALSIPDMARTHGVANAVAFCLCGLLGTRAAAPAAAPAPARS